MMHRIDPEAVPDDIAIRALRGVVDAFHPSRDLPRSHHSKETTQ
jgi:hypothetical protein